MVEFAPVKEALTTTGAAGFQRDACKDGAPWRKPLILYTATRTVGRALTARCPGCPEHIRLRGKAPNGLDWTRVASPYWPAWARSVATKWTTPLMNHSRKTGWELASPMMIAADGTSVAGALTESNYAMAKGRSIEKYSDVISAGVQPTRKALPQLLPDGLPPHLHLQAALAVQHGRNDWPDWLPSKARLHRRRGNGHSETGSAGVGKATGCSLRGGKHRAHSML